jgi:hypothetical protein
VVVVVVVGMCEKEARERGSPRDEEDEGPESSEGARGTLYSSRYAPVSVFVLS